MSLELSRLVFHTWVVGAYRWHCYRRDVGEVAADNTGAWAVVVSCDHKDEVDNAYLGASEEVCHPDDDDNSCSRHHHHHHRRGEGAWEEPHTWKDNRYNQVVVVGTRTSSRIDVAAVVHDEAMREALSW